MALSPKNPSCSPKWIRPVEVFSLRRKSKRTTAILHPLNHNVLVPRLNLVQNSEQHPVCFNPFRKCPPKRKFESLLSENEQGLNSAIPKKSSPQRELTAVFIDESANFHGDKKDIQKAAEEGCSTLPLDWSIKTRIRFMSCTPFSFRGSLKTSEEASGSTSFTRCIHSTSTQEWTIDTSANARFHQQCLFWQQPSLPWLKLFPRLNESRGGQSSAFNTQPVLESLLADWRESLRSLFHLVRVCQCPFFYMCGNTFNILFRASGVGGHPDTHALLAPTTTGIRKLLRSHGVMFSMPLRRKSDSQSPNFGTDDNFSVSTQDDLVEGAVPPKEELDGDEEQDPEQFLESLGLSQQDFPSINPKRRKIDEEFQEGIVNLQSESLVWVEGSECQTLLNFLLSDEGSSICTPNTGTLAGIPATLLSPCAFHGATLRTIKARQGWIKDGGKAIHCIDLSGPILPNMVQGLVSLFRETQSGNFSAILASDMGTTSFTSVSPEQSTFAPVAFATENLKDCGLPADLLLHLCTSSELAVLHKLKSTDKLYTWT